MEISAFVFLIYSDFAIGSQIKLLFPVCTAGYSTTIASSYVNKPIPSTRCIQHKTSCVMEQYKNKKARQFVSFLEIFNFRNAHSNKKSESRAEINVLIHLRTSVRRVLLFYNTKQHFSLPSRAENSCRRAYNTVNGVRCYLLLQ